MNIEKNLLISLLKLTKNQEVLINDVKKDARLPLDTTKSLIEKLQNQGILYYNNENVRVDSENRLKLAITAISLGSDIEQVSNLLSWQEFEHVAAIALEIYNFTVSKNVRFKSLGRRWEIDVIGCKKPLVVCIDCKHWQHGLSPSVLSRIANEQAERTRALIEALPSASIKIDFQNWSNAKFLPAVLSLIPCATKFHSNIPIVPIFQLQDFLFQLPAYTESLRFFAKIFSHLDNNF